MRTRYHIRHDTLYHYDQPVGEAHQLLRLRPRNLAHQRCITHHLDIQPEPEQCEQFIDSFGNTVHVLHFQSNHDSLAVSSEAWVEMHPPTEIADPTAPPITVAAARNCLRYQAGRRLSDPLMTAMPFRFESTHVPIAQSFRDYAAPSLAAGQPLLSAVDDLMQRIHAEFSYDPSATEVSTPVDQILARRRGVCQDFAHLMIACLRAHGLAARYVSGYLLTHPPTGQARMIGADATHAWVSVFCPEHGWVDFDPTNATRPAQEHITIGWGRDFGDISPMRGVIRGGGTHEPRIAVTVIPESEFSQLYADADLPALKLDTFG